jgi:cytochrome c-type biogenesis protein CcmH/NrfG
LPRLTRTTGLRSSSITHAGTPTIDPLRAEQALLQAVRVRPDDADATYRLALLYHDQGRPADAVPHYQSVLRLRDPFSGD